MKEEIVAKLTPRASAWARPNLGMFRCHKGTKWSVVQMIPPLYILAVRPSSFGSLISGGAEGYDAGI